MAVRNYPVTEHQVCVYWIIFTKRGDDEMKKLSILIAITLALASIAACGNNTSPTPTAQETAPAPEETAAAPEDIEAPSEETAPPAESTAPPAPSPTPTSAPATTKPPEPEPTPDPIPEETKETLTQLLTFLKSQEFDSIQPLLTEWYDFNDFGRGIKRSNFLTFLDLSEFEIINEEYHGDYSLITVSVTRPDLDAMREGYDEFIQDLNPNGYWTVRGGWNDDAPQKFESGDYETETKTYELKLVKEGDEWLVFFNRNLVELINPTNIRPFAQGSYWEKEIDREDSIAYINEHMIQTEEDGYLLVTNNGDKEVSGMTLKFELLDAEGNTARVAYREVFSGGFTFMDVSDSRQYRMPPGYMWGHRRNDLFNYEHLQVSGVNRNDWIISVFDIQYREPEERPELDVTRKEYADEYIDVLSYNFAKITDDVYRSIYGVNRLQISNNGDQTISRLSIMFEFMDEEGVVRASISMNIIDEYNWEPSDQAINPGSTWSLRSGYYFTLQHVPDFLIELGNVNISIVELVY